MRFQVHINRLHLRVMLAFCFGVALSMQTLDVGHFHTTSPLIEDCLHCHFDVTSVVDVESTALTTHLPQIADTPALLAGPRRQLYLSSLPRGPPVSTS